ncbi:hypothetical protein A8950_2368 [Dongia mobilis]|uniref:Putative DNA-binding domain-containing protein n=1 Tax=Dongia mobilis TaxID=578943 RepID=A0A4R6WY34_9PROT|nr:putative DNA-binding domain-containing protein [Dongia mobilis]TDQ82545.1 hypothetical protein A8950_2368 [Dongia mobilis]
MTTLADLQRQFQDHLTLGSQTVLPAIQTQGELAPADRLGIYRYAYRQRLTEALANDFPGLAALLGATAFADLARRYVAAHPSRNPSLRWFGAQLPAFAAADPLVTPVATGMARFDWAVAMAFDAPDEAAIGLADLAGMPPESAAGLRFTFVASLAVVAGDAGLGELRRGLLRGEGSETAALGDESAWLVWRQGDSVQYRSLPAAERVALEVMQGGGSLGEMCLALAAGPHEAAPAQHSAAQFINDWLTQGLVAAFAGDAAPSTQAG